MAPTGTPQAVIDRLHKDTLAVLARPDLVEAFAKQGADVISSSPAEFGTMIAKEKERWAEVIRKSGAKID